MSDRTDKLIAFGYEAGWAAARAMPAGAAYRMADAAADLAMSRRGPAIVQYAKNLKRVLGDRATPALLHETTAAGVRSYARYWLETFRLPSMDRDLVAAQALATLTGMQYCEAAVESGRGLVLVLPHSGNWDVAGLMLAHKFGSLTSVAERLKPESLYRKFVEYRELLGMEILPLTGGATSTSSALKDRLMAGGIVCLLGDRDLTASGVPVTFFGHRTRMPAGPAMLAALTGADLCVVHLSFLPNDPHTSNDQQNSTDHNSTARGWRATVSPPVELVGTRLAEKVRLTTQAVAAEFEKGISAYPADWHMLQPLWIDDLPAGHVAAQAKS